MGEYFCVSVRDKIHMIGYDGIHMGRNIGREIKFGAPTGNSWLIEGDKFSLLIDSAAEKSGLRKFAESIVDNKVYLVLTHAHPDHIYRICEFDEFWRIQMINLCCMELTDGTHIQKSCLHICII